MQISVIVPIYNVADYLSSCLESLEQQTYKNLQIILINDGSPDHSPEIAQSFVDKDKRFQLIHQENEGLSAARNTGLVHVKGEYVFFLDSDDFLKSDALEQLLTAAIDLSADLVQGNFYYDYSDHILYAKFFSKDKIIYNQKEAFLAIIEQNEIKNFAWGKLIKADIAKRHIFPNGLYFEDTFWICQILQEVKKCVVLKKPILHYLQRDSGISGSFSIRNLDQLFLLDKRLEFFNDLDENLFDKAYASFKETLIQHSLLLKNLNESEQKIFKEKLHYYIEKYQLDKNLINQTNTFSFKIIGLLKKIKNRIYSDVRWVKVYK